MEWRKHFVADEQTYVYYLAVKQLSLAEVIESVRSRNTMKNDVLTTFEFAYDDDPGKSVVYLTSIWVHPGHRGHGVGGAALKFFIDIIRDTC